MNYFVFKWTQELFDNLNIPYPYNVALQYLILGFCICYMLRYIFRSGGRRY